MIGSLMILLSMARVKGETQNQSMENHDSYLKCFLRKVAYNFLVKRSKSCDKKWGVKYRASCPGHQHANSKAEAGVKRAKCIIGITSKQDPAYLAVFEYRNIPSQDSVKCPSVWC